MIELIDNFLEKDEFHKLESVFFSHHEDRPYLKEYQKEHDENIQIPWYYRNSTSYSPSEDDNSVNNYQFVHIFYADHTIASPFFDHLKYLMDKIGFRSLLRCKANLQMRSEVHHERKLHRDRPNGCKPDKDPYRIGIYYLNTNNGYTLMEDSTKIESVANRLAVFSPKLWHASATCTDEKRRIILNMNWY